LADPSKSSPKNILYSMKTRFATFFGAVIKKVPKFDEVFYVKVKKKFLPQKSLALPPLKSKKI